MAGTTTSETCRERLGRLLDAYPMLPAEVIVKEDARRLLETDMPSRNPQLVAKMAEKFGSAA